MKFRTIFIILFFTLNLYSQEKIKILITNFININQNEEYNYIIGAIGDALKANLYSIEEFSPYLLEDLKKGEKISENYEELIKYALTEKFDIIIKGHFYIDLIKEKIRISFSVMEVITNRLKISYDAEGELGIEIFSLIKSSSKILSEKMNLEIKPYPSEFVEKKRKELLIDKNIDFLIIFSGNLIYSLFLLRENGNKNAFFNNESPPLNSISTLIDTKFNFELPNNRDYLGFDFYISVPIIMPDYLFVNFETGLGFSYAFKKRHFFNLSFNILMNIIDFEDKTCSYNSNLMLTYILIFYLGFGLRYDYHINKNHILQAGLLFFIPNMREYNTNKILSREETQINKINLGYNFNANDFKVINNSLLTPLILHLSYLFYIGNIGYNITTRFGINYFILSIPVNDLGYPADNYGEYFAPFFLISIGMSFKDNYIIRIEQK